MWMFFTNPIRGMVGLLGTVAGGLVLLVAIAHSPHAAAYLGGIWGALLLLLAVKIPLKWVLALGALAFVLVGTGALISELVSSGILALLLVVLGFIAVIFAVRWAHVARSGAYSPAWHRRRYHRRRWRWL